MQRKALGAIIAATAIITGFLLYGIYSESIIRYLFAIKNSRDIASENLSDSELINRTKELPEVKAFLMHYLNSTIYVEQDEDPVVAYQIRECEVKRQSCIGALSIGERYNELRVRLDDNYNPTSIVLSCVHNVRDEQKTYKIENDILWRDAVIDFLDKDICIFW